MDVLYVNNDHVVELQGLRDDAGSLLSGATAEATLYESDGTTEVTGVTWPLALVYAGSRGIYRAVLSEAVDVVDGRRYELKITATYAGRRLEVRRHVRIETRYG